MTAPATAAPGTAGAPRASDEQAGRASSTGYEMFIGLLTVLSLGLMVWMVIVRNPEVQGILVIVDTLFCVVFLFDFARSLILAPDKRAYMLPQGVFDLLGSLPAIGPTEIGLLRLFRLARLARIQRLVRGRGAGALTREFFSNRQETAVYLIVILVILVLLFGSVFVVYAESGAPDANIQSASDAIWWAWVTITTVGYGDRYPVTQAGRLVGMLTMAVGIGIFGVVSSYLASYFLSGKKKEDQEAEEAEIAPATPTAVGIAAEVATLRSEIAALHDLVSTLALSTGQAAPGTTEPSTAPEPGTTAPRPPDGTDRGRGPG
jgi:hypothetical protein